MRMQIGQMVTASVQIDVVEGEEEDSEDGGEGDIGGVEGAYFGQAPELI
jgi:hypothetical protein